MGRKQDRDKQIQSAKEELKMKQKDEEDRLNGSYDSDDQL